MRNSCRIFICFLIMMTAQPTTGANCSGTIAGDYCIEYQNQILSWNQTQNVCLAKNQHVVAFYDKPMYDAFILYMETLYNQSKLIATFGGWHKAWVGSY